MNTSHAGSSLHRKVYRGIFWVISTGIISRVLNLASAVILARLLSPADFGLMAVAMAIVSFSQGTTNTGFESAIIQKQHNAEDYLNAAWTIELIRNVALAFILIILAPLLSQFFKEPRITLILQVLSVSFILQGFKNINVIYFRKDLEFNKQFVLEVIPQIANILVVIPLAYYLRNVWALVFATLVASFATSLISYVMHPRRPRIEFNKAKISELLRFGKWILGQSIVVMCMDQAVTMFIGKFHGMTKLGFFNRANVFSSLIFQQIIGVSWKIGYPAYSKLQNETVRFKRAYLRTLQILTFFGFPMAAGLIILSKDFVNIFLTDKWLSIVPVMQILSAQALFLFINASAEISFQACGRPKILTKITMIGAIVLFIAIYPLSHYWGIAGSATALLLSTLITSPIMWHTSLRIMKISVGEFMKPIVFTGLNTIIMCAGLYLIRVYFIKDIHYVQFFGLIFCGMSIYMYSSYLMRGRLGFELSDLISGRIS